MPNKAWPVEALGTLTVEVVTVVTLGSELQLLTAMFWVVTAEKLPAKSRVRKSNAWSPAVRAVLKWNTALLPDSVMLVQAPPSMRIWACCRLSVPATVTYRLLPLVVPSEYTTQVSLVSSACEKFLSMPSAETVRRLTVSTLKLALSATAGVFKMALLPCTSWMVPPLSVRALASMLMPLASFCPACTVYLKVSLVPPEPLT